MDVVHVASEVVPFSKTGGLADVAGALPAAQAGLGARVAVITPLYDRRRLGTVAGEAHPVRVTLGGRTLEARVPYTEAGGVRTYHLDAPPLYQRAGLYGEGGVDHPDNALRFGFLCHAALALVRAENLKPDVLHAHDWQTGLVPLLVRERLGRVFDTVFTVHNLGYQGLFPPAALDQAGIPGSAFHPGGVEYWGQVGFLKAGLVSADRLTTVSPRYADEICTPEYGHGLDGVLRARRADLVGILNGIDDAVWNPATDPHLAARYSADDLSGKQACRAALCAEMEFPARVPDHRAVLGIVSRFADQKGFDLIFEALPRLLERDVALVVLGAGEPRYEKGFRDLAAAHPDRVRVRVAVDEGLAHRIEAGADLFLMPSRYEPCGLNQMYSLRYGTLPVVRATGGLVDSVPDADASPDGVGFRFEPPTADALLGAVDRALAAWNDVERRRTLQRRGMARDFSWRAAALKTLDLYAELMQTRWSR